MVRIALLCSVLFLTACGKRYSMHNMLPEEIDVTYWVEDKNYKPVYYNGKISSLINPLPDSITKTEIISLKQSIIGMAKNSQLDTQVASFNQTIILQKPKYEYSYFIDYDPVDVYSIKAFVSDTTMLFFFRKKNNEIMGGIKQDEGWIVNSN